MSWLLPSTVCLALAVAGCGQSQSAGGGGEQPSTSPSSSGHGHDDHHSHSDGDSGPPAYSLTGDLRTGRFAALPGAPQEETANLSGDIWVAENDDGTAVTVELTGLQAGADYMGHLHAQACDQDAGGPHFAFDPDGSEMPPNEVHFGFTANEQGAGAATVHNPQRVGTEARSAVLHSPSGDDRLVCADLRRATDQQIQQANGSMSEHMADAVEVDVVIRDGQVTPSGQRIEAKVGQPVVLAVSSDQADEIHVHTSPSTVFEVKPTDGQQFDFTFSRPGIYEVETHETGTVMLQVAVTP